MSMTGRLLASIIFIGFGVNAVGAETDVGFSFVVVGDTPYGEADEKMLAEAVPAIHNGGYPFVIHVGDYKGGGTTCTKGHDEAFAQLIDDLKPLPVFYTPGDNEWTDCDRFKDPETGQPMSDLSRLSIVRNLFANGTPIGAETFKYARQPSLSENATWTYRGVRFLTLHVTGTNNGRDWVTGDPLAAANSAVETRDIANSEWLKTAFSKAAEENAKSVVIAIHGDPTDIRKKPQDKMCEGVSSSDKHPCDAFTELRAAIRDGAAGFGKPVLLIHGDTAPFTLGQTFSGEENENLWRLNAGGDAGIGRTGFAYGLRDVVEVTVTLDEKPFIAKGLLTGKQPKAK